MEIPNATISPYFDQMLPCQCITVKIKYNVFGYISTELLLKIFTYLEIEDLCRLKQTCKRFNEIITKWTHIFNIDIEPLVTNQIHQDVINRSARILSPFERVRISRNWRMAIYKEKKHFHTDICFIPWLQLEQDLLWVSRGYYVYAFKRKNNGISPKSVVYNITGSKRGDVLKFVKRGNFCLAGESDVGTLWLWSLEKKAFEFYIKSYHTGDINSVDMNRDVIVSGSCDHHVKIKNFSVDKPLEEINLFDRIWSVALQQDSGPLLAIGTSGLHSPLQIYDMERKGFCQQFRGQNYKGGVLDIKWESPSTLWSCGHDSYVRRWDIRTGKCEQAMGDPCLAAVYCFQYDQVNTIVSGTATHGRVVLWDARQDHYVQMYFMDSCRRRGRSSPVFSLSYDANLLFTVTDQYVNILDFSYSKGCPRDYSTRLFKKIIEV